MDDLIFGNQQLPQTSNEPGNTTKSINPTNNLPNLNQNNQHQMMQNYPMNQSNLAYDNLCMNYSQTYQSMMPNPSDMNYNNQQLIMNKNYLYSEQKPLEYNSIQNNIKNTPFDTNNNNVHQLNTNGKKLNQNNSINNNNNNINNVTSEAIPNNNQSLKNDDLENHSKSTERPSDFDKYRFIPNHADFENNHMENNKNNNNKNNKNDNNKSLKIHVSGKTNNSAPYVFEDSICIDEGLSIPKIASTSFINWHKDYQTMNTKIPMILYLNPFAKLSVEESPEAPIDRTGIRKPMRCSRCRAYFNSRCSFDASNSTFRCSLCHENTPIPTCFCNENDPQFTYGHQIESSKGTYDILVDGIFLEPSGNKNQPVFVFLIEISELLKANDVFNKIFDVIKDFIFNDSKITSQDDIPFILAMYTNKHIFFVSYDSFTSNAFLYTALGNQDSIEMNIEKLLMRQSSFPPERIDSIFNNIKQKICSITLDQNQKSQFDNALKIIASLLNCSKTNARISIFQNTPLISSKSRLNNLLPSSQIPQAASKLGFNESSAKNAFEGALKTLNVQNILSSNPYDELIKTCKDQQKFIIDLYMITNPTDLNCKQAEKLCYETSGNLHILFDLQDFSVIKDRLISTKSTVFNVNFVIRSSFNSKIDKIYGPHFLNVGPSYSLNGLNSNQAFCVSMKPESNSFPPHQSNIIIQPAFLYTDILGRRLARIINIEVPLVNSYAEIFVGANPDVLNAYFLKKVTENTKKDQTNLNSSIEECIQDCANIFQVYLKNVVSYKDSQAKIENTLRMPLRLSILPSSVTAINYNFGTNKALCPNSDLYSEFSIINLYSNLYESNALIYPMIYCFSDVMNDDIITTLPPRIRALKSCINRSKIYLISNGFKILLSIGEDVPFELLSTIFKDPQMHKIFHMSANLNTCTNQSKQGRNLLRLFDLVCRKSKMINQVFITFFPSSSKSTSIRLLEDLGSLTTLKCIESIHQLIS